MLPASEQKEFIEFKFHSNSLNPPTKGSDFVPLRSRYIIK